LSNGSYIRLIPNLTDIASIGCSAKIEKWLAGVGAGEIKSIGKLRSMVRQVLKGELAEIGVDRLATRMSSILWTEAS
jgi:hypothetical protein